MMGRSDEKVMAVQVCGANMAREWDKWSGEFSNVNGAQCNVKE